MNAIDWRIRVRLAFGDLRTPDDDVIEELAQHAAAAFEAARAEGCDGDEAERRVQSQVAAWVADAGLLVRRPRRPVAIEAPPQVSPGLAGLGREIRHALLSLRRQPAVATLVVLTLALAVGATTILTSVAYGVLVKPMPWPDAERLVRLTETRQGATRKPTYFTNGTYLAWADNPSTIDAIGAWAASTATVAGAGEAERLRVVEATPSLLSMLGVRPALGRLFASPSAGGDATDIVLSHQLWQRKFSASPAVIGRPVRIDGKACRVAGVMPAGFAFPDEDVQAYVPFDIPPVGGSPGQGGRISLFAAMARLRPGVTPAQAAAEATARARAVPDPGVVTMAVFGSQGPAMVQVVPWLDSVVGEVRSALVIFLAAVALLLAVATANVASLQLARSAARRREFAIRSALGAGAGRLARQLLVENVVIGQLGGLVGLAFAAAVLRVLPAIAWTGFPRMSDIALDWRTAAAAFALALGASLVFGLAPVLQARRLDVTAVLAEDGAAPVGAGSRSTTGRVRLAIMTGQVAASAVLLVGAVLLGRSFLALANADRGFNPSNVISTVVTMPDDAFTPVRRAQVLDALVERIRAVPGVTAAAFSTKIPLVPSGEVMAAFPVPSRKGGGLVPAHASLRFVSPGFFEALGMRMRGGRSFRATDTSGSQEVVIVNRAFAAQYLDGTGVGVRMPASKGQREVVGVIEDARYAAPADTVQPEMYVCSRQSDGGFQYDEMALLVRTSGAAGTPCSSVAACSTLLRSLVREQDASLALGPTVTMEDRVWTSLARPRFYAVLLGGFAALALTVAGVGLFGVLSYNVSLRARELGVRATLGATPARLVALVARQAVAVGVVGAAAGLAAAAALGKWMSTLLFGVEPGDTGTFVTVAAVVMLVAVVASAVPARRAAKVEPIKVLR
jgi:putative ABC transport system permease protein